MPPSAEPITLAGRAWPEADALFHRDPRFLGADDAYSADLGGDRTLWLFGDTFVGDGKSNDRRQAAFIRNSIAVQDGRDPCDCTIDFHWRQTEAGPDSFIDAPEGEWRWPLDAIRTQDGLLMFFMRVRSPIAKKTSESTSGDPIDEWRAEGALSFFEVFGWIAFRVLDPDAAPSEWIIEEVAAHDDPSGIVLGAAMLNDGPHLYLYGWRPSHDGVYLARQIADRPFAIDAIEWWDGEGWSSEAAAAVPVADQAKTEFTVKRGPSGEGFQMVQTRALIGADVALRTAPSPEGPWSGFRKLYEPPEMSMPGVMVYAAKAHPQLTGAPMVLTYASNGADVDATLDNFALYFPRFIRVMPADGAGS